ncbi:MAG: hypothetical protein ACI4EF_10215 [Coprococcus sp.]
MFELIGNVSVLERTIHKCKLLGLEIISSVFSCNENKKLIDILKRENVRVIESYEENTNKRFMDSIEYIECIYIIRVGGDQVLIDIDRIKEILSQMHERNDEWFFEKRINSVIPDIIRKDVLLRYRESIQRESRYFFSLEKENIKKYNYEVLPMLINSFRANCNEGFRLCRDVIENDLNIYDLSANLINTLSNNRDLIESGIWRSWIIPPQYSDFYLDENNEVNPWLSKPFIDFIRPRLNKNMSVFEWGCGNSTLFWSHNVERVTAIEYNPKWIDKMKNVIGSNAEIRYYPLEYDGSYCRAINETNKQYDIVLIDGRDRVRCARNCVKNLKREGVIIWDNSQREYYQEGFIFLKEQGFKSLNFSGLFHGVPFREEETTLFYRPDNILEI